MIYIINYLKDNEWKQLCTSYQQNIQELINDERVEALQIRKNKDKEVYQW